MTTVSLSKAGLEVYLTDEEEEEKNLTKEEQLELIKSLAEGETQEEEEPEPEQEVDPKDNFKLCNGPTKQIDYVGELFNDSFEMDYTELSSNATVSVPIDYFKLFFKGKKIALK